MIVFKSSPDLYDLTKQRKKKYGTNDILQCWYHVTYEKTQ